MNRIVQVAALIAVAAAVPAAAVITDVTIRGVGVVTYAQSDPDQGIVAPAVGTTGAFAAFVHLGTAAGVPAAGYPPAPTDHFTGHYSATADEIFDHYVVYSWHVGNFAGASSTDPAQAFASADLDFVDGRVTAFSLSYVGDPDGHNVYGSGLAGGFSEDFGADSPANWGGTIVLDASPTPEPAAWALMLAGFGLVGAAERRRRPRFA